MQLNLQFSITDDPTETIFAIPSAAQMPIFAIPIAYNWIGDKQTTPKYHRHVLFNVRLLILRRMS